MNRTQQRRSVTPGHIPAVGDLLVGEIALNLADKDVFYSTGTEVVQLNSAANIKTDATRRFISDAQLAVLAAGYTLPTASASVLGGVKIGTKQSRRPLWPAPSTVTISRNSRSRSLRPPV